MRRILVVVLAVGVATAVMGLWNAGYLSAHKTAIAPHPHDDASVECPPTGGVPTPDTTNHQHHILANKPCLFGATGSTPSGHEYDAYAVWDNRDRTEDDLGTFDKGHGFIDEFGIGPDGPITVRYRFDAANPPPVDPADPPAVQAAQQEAFRALVEQAFDKWSALQARPRLITGLEFERVTGAADIVVGWDPNCDGLGTCGVKPHPPDITFDSTTDATGAPGRGGWSLEVDPTNVPNDEYHFLSTALHEAGHVVGLDEHDDPDVVMIKSRHPGCPQHAGAPANAGPCFSGIDWQSEQGALDLYSIPLSQTVPGPHYKWYEVPGPSPGVHVDLETQFGEEPNVYVGPATHLALPALKNGQGDLNAPHLRCFEISGVPPGATVRLKTQFGLEEEVPVGQPRELCMPALKEVVDPPEPPPLGPLPDAPHYECYEISGSDPDVRVALTTQFGEEPNVYVMQADRLCVPALKNGEGDLNAPHLKCYFIPTEPPPDRTVKLTTQFGPEENSTVLHSRRLCVPALKTVKIGGTTEHLVGGPDSPAHSADGSGSASPPYAAIAGGAAAAAAAAVVAAGGWYARRRWLR